MQIANLSQIIFKTLYVNLSFYGMNIIIKDKKKYIKSSSKPVYFKQSNVYFKQPNV